MEQGISKRSKGSEPGWWIQRRRITLRLLNQFLEHINTTRASTKVSTAISHRELAKGGAFFETYNVIFQANISYFAGFVKPDLYATRFVWALTNDFFYSFFDVLFHTHQPTILRQHDQWEGASTSL
jgi:hypothetical protein